MPLFPVFIIFFIGSIAETNRAPFDLAEAESELVSGFMTEHAAVIFVFFFLAEYASIVLICTLTSILFLGGYLLNIMPLIYIFYFLDVFTVYLVKIIDYFLHIDNIPLISIYKIFNFEDIEYFINEKETLLSDPLIEGILCGVILGFKTCILIFIFI